MVTEEGLARAPARRVDPRVAIQRSAVSRGGYSRRSVHERVMRRRELEEAHGQRSSVASAGALILSRAPSRHPRRPGPWRCVS